MTHYSVHPEQTIRHALGPELQARLENWGRAMRPSLPQAVSPTHVICTRLAEIAGVRKEPQPEPICGALRADAELCELAWSFMERDVRWKKALADLYVGRLPVPIVARRARAPIGRVVAEIISAAKQLNAIRLTLECGVVVEDNRFRHAADRVMPRQSSS